MGIPLFLAVAALSSLAGEPWREAAREALGKMGEGEQALAECTYEQSRLRVELDSGGREKSRTSERFRREPFDGRLVTFLTERNGQPVDERERRQMEEAAIQRRGSAPKRSGYEGMVAEVPKALVFELERELVMDGRPTMLLRFSPREGYKPNSMRARVLQKLNGRAWIDVQSREVRRVEADVFDTVTMGFGILGRVDKGSRFEMDRTPLSNGRWVARRMHARFALRVMLMKYIYTDIITETANIRVASVK